jgi:DNA (cytosine-5)-methyltransferase 1
MNPHAWFLSDLDKVPKNGIRVMSTFACGGGSSMGYKLAGCEIVAANDIDPEMAWHYQTNLKPPLYYLCPINDLLIRDLPAELFNLDILDGSPPCSTFSVSGDREKSWGVEKHFREGQTKQVLSDLFFDYLELVNRLRPKVAIAENVKGMIIGNAKGYTRMVMRRFEEIGYRPQLFLINAADCGVPQRRERVFFCALRNDIEAPPLSLNPVHKWISAGEACAGLGSLTEDEKARCKPFPIDKKWWPLTEPGGNYSKAVKRHTGKSGLYSHSRLSETQPSCTLTSESVDRKHWSELRRLTFREYKRLSTFPDDYHAKSEDLGRYMVGMSVPPKMTQAVALAVISQWLLKST